MFTLERSSMSRAKIRKLDATAVSVPLEYPIRTASGVISHALIVLIDLHDDLGLTGHAYVFSYTTIALGAVVSLLTQLDPLIRGEAIAPQSLERKLDTRFRLLGNTGLVTMAQAGIDMALWDLTAKHAGMPLARLLGGNLDPVPGYFSQGLDGEERGVALAQQCLGLGFKLMKIKAGYATLDEDLRVIAAVQAARGSRAQLAVDYNQSLSRTQAMIRCKALDGLNLAWIEEPTRCDDDEGHAAIARAIHTPVMIGENWFGSDAMARSISCKACDLVMPDLMKIGGVSGWLRACGIASAARTPISTHLFAEISAHLASATPGFQWLEVFPFADAVLQTPLRIEDGCAMLADEPGNGLQWNHDVVARFRYCL
jgi:mandelate racemase